jgi:transposase
MRQASKRVPESAEKTVRDIRRATRRHHSAEEKIRIVLEGLRGEDSIAELCRKEGINQTLYYRWSNARSTTPDREDRALGQPSLLVCAQPLAGRHRHSADRAGRPHAVHGPGIS